MGRCEGDCGVAGEGRLVGVPKFHSWGNYIAQVFSFASWGVNTRGIQCIGGVDYIAHFQSTITEMWYGVLEALL